MTSLVDSAEGFIIGLEKAEADLKAVAHRLEEGFEQQYGRHQVSLIFAISPHQHILTRSILLPSDQSL